MKPKLGLVIAAALVGMNQAAQAQVPIIPNKFVPFERLSPDIRAYYEKQIRELEKNAQIDWESVILGVDENGVLTLKDRKSVELEMVSEPSCWTAPF
ncbi:MAG: hypothetical protein ACLGG7_07165 [Bacteriovoracia bacterium]